MIKRIGRRFVSLLLTFVTILTMLPAMTQPALAATKGTVTGLADENIGLSFTGNADDAWSANGTGITGEATSTGGTCGDTPHKSTLTITNKKSTTATLSFDYSIEQNSGEIEVDRSKVSSGASFTKELAANESIEVYIKSGSTSAATKITLTNVVLVSEVNATATFVPAENGTYTVDGKLITEEYSNTQSSMTAYQVVATPADGYQFLGWYNETEKKYINTSPKAALNIESNYTITARFASKTAALFETGGQRFADLNEAVAYAQANGQSKITLATDGSISGTYTIPAGITLLIPFDAAGTLYTNAPAAIRTTPASKPFRTLTMSEGTSITVNGAISLGGRYFAAGGDQQGRPVGDYGYIKMADNSSITVQDGASLYAWGFISGSGAVTVQSGGSVYEWYQILDFRGGSATTNMGNKVFPFNQYAVQNIEVPLTMHTGASETAYAAIYALSKTFNSSISFIGAGSLFELTSGSLTKAYDGSTDRMIYTIDGIAKLNSLTLTLAGKEVNSSSYVLPLTNNMTIDLKSGSKLTLNQTAALLPGVEVSIARNAELVVPKDQSMYIYDVDEWGNYCGGGNNNSTFIPVVNAPGRNGKRAPLEDVKVDVNGKLTAIGGIYTTNSGANICSSEGTGKYLQQGAPGKETTTYQYDGSTKVHDIPITPAKLKNFDGSYTETAKASTGQTIPYCTCPTCGGGKWVPNLMVAEFDAKQYGTLQEAANAAKGAPYVSLLHSTTEDINAQNDLYLDLHGYTVTGDFNMGKNTLYGMDSATDDYVGTNAGKIVGSVTPYAKTTYQTGNPGDAYKRYVGILREESGTPTLSFHRFNISVTGYRFELAAPQCALIFCGKFQGDKAAKDYLKSLGFTLTGNNSTESKNKMSDASNKEFVKEEGDAYLFELYLIRSFEKNSSDATAYTEEFSATAQATFKNGGTQDSGTKESETKEWSFQKAWEDALKPNSGMEEKDQEILRKFLKEFGINIQVE